MAQATSRTPGSNGISGATAVGTTADISGGGKDIPRDARIIGLILASLGVTDAEPGVVAMLLEFAHRYTLEILQEAQIYADHAQRPRDPSTSASGPTALEVDDLRMAVNSKLEHSYSSPLPKEFLLPLAAQINRVPLPILPESYGIRLPHERDRLTAVNWDLVPVTERRTYPKNDNDDQEDANGMAVASTSQAQAALNGTGTSGGNGNAGNMDLDLSVGDNLFGGNDDDDEDDDDDDDDDEDMEEVVDPSLQPGRSQSKEHDDGEGEEDAEDDDGEDDGDDDEDDDDDDNGEEEDNDGEENEYDA